MRDLVSCKQFETPAAVDKIIDLAGRIRSASPHNGWWTQYRGKTMATLFYEPSTRTRLSFEAAMCKYGGSVISTENAAQFSSQIKGETLADSVRVVSGYADLIVLRHSVNGSAQLAADVSSVPVINAGDGSGEHPSQALLDVYTIKAEVGRLDNLKVGLCGDLKYGRTVHSLVRLLSLYPGLKIQLVSPASLKLPDEYVNELRDKGVEVVTAPSMWQLVENPPDVIYMTRVQRERLQGVYEETEANQQMISLTAAHMVHLPEKTVILHPLPRGLEIPTELDGDKRIACFRQAHNGLYVRMAIIDTLLRNS